MQATKNIDGAFDLTPSEWHNLLGKRVHLGVCGGQATDEAIFIGLFELEARSRYIPPDDEDDKIHPFTLNHLRNVSGISVNLRGTEHNLCWGDIIEFWPLQ